MLVQEAIGCWCVCQECYFTIYATADRATKLLSLQIVFFIQSVPSFNVMFYLK